MKAVACLIGLCLLAGLVTADYGWEQGKQYRYKVRGRVMAGISEINTQYAGLQLEYVQVVTVGHDGVVNVKTEELKAIEVNEELDGGWRDGQIQKGQEASIPSELKHFLTAPMDMIVKRGVVESIKVPSELPTWAVNIKKAMASVFTLDTTGTNKILGGNLNRKTEAQTPEEANQESGFFYEVLEQSVHGECEVYYTVSQNGPYDDSFQAEKQAQAGQGSGSSSSSESLEQQGKRQSQNRIYKAYKHYAGASSSSSSSESSEESSKEQPWPRAFNQLCDQDDQIYEIIKTVNFTACTQKPTLAYTSPSELNFRPADNAGGSLWGRALVSRYLACGTSRQNYTILKITQQERFHTGLRELEKVVAGAQKNVTLVSITTGHPTPVQNPKTINNLVYTFDPKEQQLQKEGRLQQASTMSGSDSSSESQEQYQSDAAYINRQHQQKQSQKNKQFSSSSSEEMNARRPGHQQQKSQSQKNKQFSSSSSEEVNARRPGHQQQKSQSQKNKQFSSSSSEEVNARRPGHQQQKSQSQKNKRQSQSSSSSSSSSEEYNPRRGGRQAYQTFAEGKGQLPQPSLEQAPLSSMLITPLKKEQMQQRVNELMKEIVQDLTKPTEKDSIAERETLSKISTVVKVLRVLNKQQVEEIAQKWCQSGNEQKQQEVGRSIFLDALAIAGTNPTVVYLLKQIKAGQLTGEEAAQCLATLPMYIRTPTKELLEKYFEIIDQETVKRQEQVRTTAMLSFSTLLYNACINKRVKNSRYPVALYGEFCSENYVAQKYVPYFIQRLEKRLETETQSQSDKHWIITLLTVLGNLGHPDTIEVVQKIMDEETDPLIKVKAIYALKNLIQARSNLNQQQGQRQQRQIVSVDRMSFDQLTDAVVEQQVLPVLVSVAFDRGEHPEVRNAAFSLLFHCTYADVAIWQQAALATWFEPSRDVRCYIYSTLKSLANLETPLKGTKWVMQRKARAVLPMAKPIDASIARSHNLFSAKFFEEVSSGFAQQLSYFESQDSLFPNHIYYRNFFQFGNGAAGVHPVEFSVAGNTIQKLATAFIEAVTQGESEQELKGHKDLHEIKNLLNIESRQQDQEPALGSIYIKLRDEIERLWTFDAETVEKLAQQLAQGANAQGELNVNYQKAVHMAEHLASMPTIMGFPLVYHMRMPALVSVRGTIKLQNPSGSPEMALQADLAPVYAWKIHRKLAFKCPFTGKKYQAGVQRHVVVEAPFSLVARKAPQGQLQLAITPAHLRRGAPSGTINLATYHQIPYTAIITDELYPTIYSQGGKMEIVHANEEQQDNYQNQQTYGQDMLGLHFQIKEESEFPKQQENVSGWARFIRRFHTAGCAFNAAWLGSPSIRYAKREIILDLDKSETKTLVIQVAARTQRLSTIKQLQSSEESDSSSSSESNGISGSSSSSSSSSSSEESQQWFQNVRSPRTKQQAQQQKQQAQQRKQQQKQEKQQQQGQSQSQSQSQSGSSSSSSESGSQSAEALHERTRGHTLILVLLGKKAPLQSLDELKNSVQKPLQKGSQNTVQYLLQIAQNPQGKLFVRAAIGEACNQAAEVIPQISRAFQAIREAIVDSPNSQSQPKVCLEFQGSMDTPKKASRHIVAVRRETLLAQDLTVKVNGKLQAGQSCRSLPLYVKVEGKLHRDQEQTEWARSKSPQAQQCENDKKKGFTVSQVCMDVSEQQAAALNEWQFVIEHSAMPQEIQNMTVHIQNTLRALFFPQLSENQFPESSSVKQGSFELWGRMTPNKQFVSFHIRKPDALLTFNDIKTNAVVKALLPPTATQTLYGNVKDRLFRAQSDPMCSIEKNYVNTFDNVTYSFNQQAVQGCQHVLAKDCSGRYPMAVLVKNLDQDSGRAVTILLGQETKIKIVPSGQRQQQQEQSHFANIKNRIFGGRNSQQQAGASGMTVHVNGQQQRLPFVVKSQGHGNNEPIAEIMTMPNGGVQVIGRRIQVATDGQRVIVYGNNVFRNRTCGICGDFNNEKVADMRSPKDFPLSSGTLLVASYAFTPLDGSSKCEVNKQIERQIQKEEKIGQQDDRYVPNIYQRGKHYAAQQQQRRQQQQQQRVQQQKYMKKQYNKLQFWFFNRKNQTSSSSSSSSSSEEQQHQNQQNQQYQHQNQQNSMVFQQKMMKNPKNSNEICFSLNRLPTCAHGYEAKKMNQKPTKFHCMEKDSQQVETIKQHIQQGQYHDLAHKQQQLIKAPVPQQCVRA